MKTLRTHLADYLRSNGWEVLEHVDELEWWADEIWELRSLWSPQGASGYVTFLVDPMWEGNRRKGQGVWAVGCSADDPKDRGQACDEGMLRLKVWRKEIDAFLEAVDGFRSSRYVSRDLKT